MKHCEYIEILGIYHDEITSISPITGKHGLSASFRRKDLANEYLTESFERYIFIYMLPVYLICEPNFVFNLSRLLYKKNHINPLVFDQPKI